MRQLSGKHHVQVSGFGDPMAISHELSSEIATALFADKKRSPAELNELKKMVFHIHSTLEQSTAEGRTAPQTPTAAAAAAAATSSERKLN